MSGITIYSIFQAFKDNSKQIMRGENAYKSGHVKKMRFSSATQPATISGEVQASMRNKTYLIEVSILLPY